MPIVISLPTDMTSRMLVELCARNHTAELVLKREGGAEIRAKVRFLELADSELWVDYPTVAGRGVALPEDIVVRLFFCFQDDYFSFVTRTLGRTKWCSQSSVQIAALRLEQPAEIERNQRRSCYRLSMLQHPSTLLRFQVMPDKPGTEPERIEVAIRNLSETGCGLSAAPEVAARLRVGQHCRAAIRLPGQEEIFEISGKVCWIQKNHQGEQAILGVSWQWDGYASEIRILQSRLARFIMSAQLETLRRRREEENVNR